MEEGTQACDRVQRLLILLSSACATVRACLTVQLRSSESPTRFLQVHSSSSRIPLAAGLVAKRLLSYF